MNEISYAASVLSAGLLLGLTHALDADHIAAVSTLASREKKISKLLRLGGIWGLGHTISILIVGIFVLLFKVQLSEQISLLLESFVGIMLIFLGVRLIKKIRHERIHIHVHEHDGRKHAHFHSHASTKQHNHSHQPLIIGLIHGLAGSAAITLLVLSTIDSIGLGISYLLIFGFGSIVGMAIVSSLIGLPIKWFSKNKKIIFMIQSTAAAFSIFIGSTLIIEFALSL